MTEETKATLKDNLHKTGNSIMETGKKVFTARNLKKGASILILLAVVGAGGKYFLHQNKVEARNRADEARTTLLQNLAAQNNVQLASTEDVKNKVAQALGTDAAQVKFTSVNLISPEFTRDGGQGDKHERGDKHGVEHEREDKHEREEKYGRGDKHEREEKSDRGDQHEREEKSDRGDRQPQQLQRRSGAPLLYSVKCTKDNVNYKFLVGAQDGKILRSSVEPAHSFLGK